MYPERKGNPEMDRPAITNEIILINSSKSCSSSETSFELAE